MDIDKIKELADLMNNNGISHIKLENIELVIPNPQKTYIPTNETKEEQLSIEHPLEDESLLFWSADD